MASVSFLTTLCGSFLTRYIENQRRLVLSLLGPKKYRKIARMYDRTGSEHEMYPYKNRPFPTFRPEFRPFVDALNNILART